MTHNGDFFLFQQNHNFQKFAALAGNLFFFLFRDLIQTHSNFRWLCFVHSVIL